MDYNDVLVPLCYEVPDADWDERLDDTVASWRSRIPVVGEKIVLVDCTYTSVRYSVTEVSHETYFPYDGEPYPVNRVYLERIPC